MSVIEPAIAPALAATDHDKETSIAADNVESLGATLREMAGELVEARELLVQMTRRDISARYKQALFGYAWAIFMPLLVVVSGMLVKVAMAHVSGTRVESEGIAELAVKALPWSFFVGAIGAASGSLISNRNLITKIYFPREVFPLSAVLTQAFDTSVGLVGLLLLLYLGLGTTMSLATLWVAPLVLCFVMFTAGACLFISCANLFFRDVKYLVAILLQFGIFFTPVFYNVEFFGNKGAAVMMLNPLAPFIEGFRLAVVHHHNLLTPFYAHSPWSVEVLVWHPLHLVYIAVLSVLGFFGAWWMFHKLEFLYAEYA